MSLGKKLHLLGAVLWARPLLQEGWVGSYDQLVNIWQQGRLSDIDFALAGRRATPVLPGINNIGAGVGANLILPDNNGSCSIWSSRQTR